MGERADVWQGTLALMVLKTLQALGPLHGYGIARRIEQTSGDLLAVNYGTLYPALLRARPLAGAPAWNAPAAGAAIRNRSRSAVANGLFPLRHRLHRRGNAPRACLQLHPVLFPAPVCALRRDSGLCHHHPGTYPGLRTSRGPGNNLLVRQHEGGSNGLRRGTADLQHAFPGFRHALRLQALGLPSPSSPNEGEN